MNVEIDQATRLGSSTGFNGWLQSHLKLAVAVWLAVTFVAHYLWTCQGLEKLDPRLLPFSLGAVFLFMRINIAIGCGVTPLSRQFTLSQGVFALFCAYNLALYFGLRAVCSP